MTKSLEHYLENADELAQQVVNVWGRYTSIGHGDALSSEFMALFEKALRYRQTEREASNHRKFSLLTAEEDAEEKESRLVFAEAYKACDDSTREADPLSRAASG